MRILPGVVTEFNQGESVGFGAGGNNTQGYTVNGIRSSGNTVSLDGSAIMDIGNNGGVIVSLNNDMVQEVKVQSSNFAAEYGAGGMSVSGVTKSGSSKFHGSAYDYWRDYKFAANDRSNSIAGTEKPKSTYQYPGGNVGGPLVVRRQLHQEPRPAVLLRRLREPAAEGRLRFALHAHLLAGDAQRRLQRAAGQSRLEPEQHPAAAHSEGRPRRRRSRAEQQHGALHHADRQVPRQPVSAAELQRPEQSLQLRLQLARAEQPLRLQEPLRLEHQQQHQGLRPHRAGRRDGHQPARRVVGARKRRRAPDVEHRHQSRPLLCRQRRVGPQPVDDQRSAGQLQPADARQPLRGSEPPGAGRRRHQFPGHLPGQPTARICRPICCTAGAAPARSATCGRRPTTCTPTTTRCSSATS